MHSNCSACKLARLSALSCTLRVLPVIWKSRVSSSRLRWDQQSGAVHSLLVQVTAQSHIFHSTSLRTSYNTAQCMGHPVCTVWTPIIGWSRGLRLRLLYAEVLFLGVGWMGSLELMFVPVWGFAIQDTFNSHCRPEDSYPCSSLVRPRVAAPWSAVIFARTERESLWRIK